MINEKKIAYQAPETETILLQARNSVLNNSLDASRSSYGTANEETWE